MQCKGTVIQQEGSTVMVSLLESEACQSCKMCIRKPSSTFTVQCNQHLTIGQEVTIEINPRAYLITSLLFFAVPIADGTIAAFIVWFLFKDIPEWIYVLAFFAGLCLSFAMVKLVVHFSTLSEKLQPRIIDE